MASRAGLRRRFSYLERGVHYRKNSSGPGPEGRIGSSAAGDPEVCPRIDNSTISCSCVSFSGTRRFIEEHRPRLTDRSSTAESSPLFGGQSHHRAPLQKKTRQKNHFAGVLLCLTSCLWLFHCRQNCWMRERSRSPVGTLRTSRRATAALALL